MILVKSKSWDEPLSPHYSLKEFRCRCDHDACQATKVDMDLVDILEEIHGFFGAPIKVTSGFRCAEHNAEIKGAPNSQHLLGKAADILIPDHFHKAIHDRYHGRLGIGFYNNRLHIDVRKGCARWGKIPKGDSNV